MNAPVDIARMLQPRPVPAATPFVEVRDSPMLKAPLRVSGEDRHTLVIGAQP